MAGFSAAAADPPSEDQLRAWIRDLDAESFAAREAAAKNLASVGEPATALLSKCITSARPETAWRASAAMATIRANVALSGPDGAEPQVGDAQCNDDSHEPVTKPNPPRSPDPPPESDIAHALAPPPEPLPVEAVTDQVLIADAFVSPELASEGPAADILPPASPTSPPASLRTTQRALSSSVAPRQPRSSPTNVVLVRHSHTRAPLSASRENQPRVMNFFIKARALLGLSSR